MYVLMAKHLAEDFKHWFELYNCAPAQEVREQMKIVSHSILTNHVIKNEVVVMHHFKSLDDLEAFLELPSFIDALPKMGVVPPVQFTIYETLP